jgi:hypothetical protein
LRAGAGFAICIERHCPAGAIPLKACVDYPPNDLRKDRRMAAHDTPEYSTAPGNDYPAHEQMFRTFVSLAKWSVISIAIIFILMAYFLT